MLTYCSRVLLSPVCVYFVPTELGLVPTLSKAVVKPQMLNSRDTTLSIAPRIWCYRVFHPAPLPSAPRADLRAGHVREAGPDHHRGGLLPAAAREVLQKKDQALSARWVPDTARALGHHETSTIWLPRATPAQAPPRRHRHQHLLPRSLDTTRAVRERQARELVANLRRRAGQPVRIGVPVFNAVLNIISNLFFSEDVVDLASGEEESNQEFKRLISSAVEEIGRPNISDFFPFLRPLDLQGRRRVTAGYIRRFYNFFGDIFDRRLAEMNSGAEKKGDFLDSLLELHSQSKLQRREIITLFTDFFAAGSDTSSNTVEFAAALTLAVPLTAVPVLPVPLGEENNLVD
uniref:Uncharacterized protein n=1 Tax=Ananas comosus var. bracteatus TaxID=296719 RepID=A0A6V7P5R8_ANACO|nr:unnamed protein product [Ananas comosus var. bracteatus]